MNFAYMKKVHLVGGAICSHTGARQKILSNNDNFQSFGVVTSLIQLFREGTWNGMEYLTSLVSAHDPEQTE